MIYRDCNYTIFLKEQLIGVDCFTKEQLKNNINRYALYDRFVYKMNHKTRKAELIAMIKAGKEIK